MQIRPADVADEQRVAGEDEPRLLVAAAAVGYHVRVVRRRVTGGRDCTQDSVSQLDDIAVGQLRVREVDLGARRKVRGRARGLDDLRQSGDVVGLDVRLEDGDDRRADLLGGGDVGVDEVDVRIDDRELAVAGAAEQVTRARALVVQERS